MSLEQKVNYQLNKVSGVKKVIKRVYQRTMYAISPKIKRVGDIVSISPDDASHEYFFGYYDKFPWDVTDRYMLCMRVNDTWPDVSPKEEANIILINTSLPEDDENRVKKLAEQAHGMCSSPVCFSGWDLISTLASFSTITETASMCL